MNPTPTADEGRRARWDRRGPWDHRHSPSMQLAMGIFIMTIGVLLTLDRLNIIDASMALRLWPAGFIALGVTRLAQGRDSHGRFWGFGWIFLGSWLLLNTLGILRVGFWDLFWPMLLVFVGVRLIMRTRGWSAVSDGPPRAGTLNLFAVLGGSKRAVQHEVFRGANMTAVMGGCVLDLRQSILAPGEEAVIDVFAAMGGHEIHVPSLWTVVMDVVPILGGVDDKRLPVAPPDPALGSTAAPRLVVRGVVLMGGLTIKN